MRFFDEVSDLWPFVNTLGPRHVHMIYRCDETDETVGSFVENVCQQDSRAPCPVRPVLQGPLITLPRREKAQKKNKNKNKVYAFSFRSFR